MRLSALAVMVALLSGCIPGRGFLPPSLELKRPEADDRCVDAFDRNALRQVLITGDWILARTASGLIFRFDTADLRLSGEIWPASPASHLGRDRDGTVLVASVNGAVARLDPDTRRLTPLGRLDGEPIWAGTAPRPGSDSTLLGIVRRHQRARPSRWWEAEDRYLATSSHEFPLRLSGEVQTVFRGSDGRLYLGTGRGEFGGMVQVVDPSAWTSRVLCGYEENDADAHGPDRCPAGVYGFVERPDGAVLAYGGLVHLGTAHQFVARIGEEGLETLAAEEGDFQLTRERATGPLSRLLALPDGGFLGIVFDRVLRADPRLAHWSQEGFLDAPLLPGQPFAVGPGSPIVDAALLAGDPPAMVAASAGDGLIGLRAGERSAGRLSDQCSAEAVQEAFRWDGNLLLAGRASTTEGLVACRRTTAGWAAEELPLPPGLSTTALGPNLEGVQVRAVAGRPDGSVIAVYARDWIFRPTVTVSWHDGVAEIVDRSDIDVVHVVAADDGSVWADDLSDIYRLGSSGWTKVATIPEPMQFSPDGPSEPPVFRPVWVGARNRLFHVTAWDRLLRLDEDGVLRPLNSHPGPDDPDEVFDAEALDERRLLAATPAGLRVLDTRSWKYLPSVIPQPHWTVTQIARDGGGRIWLGGEGLWLLDGGRVQDLSGSRCLGREITWMGRDPSDEHAIVVSVDSRGGALFRTMHDVQ